MLLWDVRLVPIPEVNALISITSSARASTVSPSVLAVLRLIASSNFVWRLHWQIGGVLALEDAIDVTGRATVLVDEIRPIVDETTSGDEDARGVDRGQPMGVLQAQDFV